MTRKLPEIRGLRPKLPLVSGHMQYAIAPPLNPPAAQNRQIPPAEWLPISATG